MLIFIDTHNKIIYIMSPKCGTTTIANMLSVDINHKYNDKELENLNNPEYKKIIIIRKSIIDRFLSGFYEDLFNNTCYNNMDITFNDYLLFLHKCYREKIPNVDNTYLYNNLNMPLWFGNCSGVYRSITDKNGNFSSHIMSQKYAICSLVNKINCIDNVKVIELNDLSNILPNAERKNVKKKLEDENINISNMSLSYIKANRLIIPSTFLDEKQKEIILDIYKDDLLFIDALEKKFNMKC